MIYDFRDARTGRLCRGSNSGLVVSRNPKGNFDRKNKNIFILNERKNKIRNEKEVMLRSEEYKCIMKE